ncbi:hypothetical protein GYMLUDRAFT_40177 [Collybiopsis luxurians FD-317 M1]|uniref:Unplaced genomic scaffold GYMLUscaffold_14, whole genome shotgun sequence n=1 Tax=Collybiopsis luxurians FD-317 M1 TaxID=944289 RepID=A0A0D0CLS6_9AGAR|nr:hypothetical protein GYMLUDRAFT_40177 [Collybiopsis luxurians FD-317 M1]
MIPLLSTSDKVEGKKKCSSSIMRDKAKASHLSRQLQLRLQYAKLKVEHGWHKQSLNEVENLYFRRSHPPSRHSSDRPTSQSSSDTSFVSQPLLSQMKATHSDTNKSSASPEPAPPSSRISLATDSSSSTVSQDRTTLSSDTASLSSNEEIKPSHQATSSHTASKTSSALPSVMQTASPLSARAAEKQPAKSAAIPMFTSGFQSQAASISTSSMPAYPASVSTPSSIPQFPILSNLPLLPSGPSLTYDSFWSSHTASAIARRPLTFRPSAAGTSAFPGKSEQGMGKEHTIGTGITAYPDSFGPGQDTTFGTLRTSSEPGVNKIFLPRPTGSAVLVTNKYPTSVLGIRFAVPNGIPVGPSPPSVRVEGVTAKP